MEAGHPDLSESRPAGGRDRSLLGWTALVLGLPLAGISSVLPPNEYQAALDIAAIDCDGPMQMLLFAMPAMVLYGTAWVINGFRCRRQRNLMAAFACMLIRIPVGANLVKAIKQEIEQSAACDARS